MGANRCPQDPASAALEFLAGRGRSPAFSAHLVACPRCRALVAAMRRDEDLLTELRAAESGGVDVRTRRRVVEICERVMSEESQRRPL
jgi:anti-sigma factor RsiW